jgi:type IV pilus assembly protein PilM
MNLLPKASGTRPRVACEIMPQGVVAARSALAGSPLTAVAKVDLPPGAVSPSLKPGNVVDRVQVAAALRQALEAVGLKPNARDADISLILPDSAVRVLLLDFDALSSRITEALPIIRFRLKKLLPFDADEAMISFQVMSSGKSGVRVLAVAVPRDVLSEYETAAREAGFEPGAVLPSTLAALAALEDDSSALLVNANTLGVTTAIVRSGIVLLHLSIDLQQAPQPTAAPSALYSLPLVNVEDSASEWAAQQPEPEHGRNPYAAASLVSDEPAPIEHSPYAGPTVLADLSSELHNAILVAPTSLGTLTEDASGQTIVSLAAAATLHPPAPPADPHTVPLGEEIAQAVSKGAAYFEDTLAIAPSIIYSAGPLGADALRRILSDHGVAEADGLKVREVVDAAALEADAVSARVPRGWLAGVLGALKG